MRAVSRLITDADESHSDSSVLVSIRVSGGVFRLPLPRLTPPRFPLPFLLEPLPRLPRLGGGAPELADSDDIMILPAPGVPEPLVLLQ